MLQKVHFQYTYSFKSTTIFRNMQENQGKSFGKSYWQGGNVYKCAKNIRKMKWYPIIRILLYLRDIESKEKNYEESIK